jgi:hypothetical protein
VKFALFGPVCFDENIVNGKSYFKPGGVAYYAGRVLKHLGGEVTIFGSFGKDMDTSFLDCEVLRVSGEGTMKFTNIYPSASLDERIQRAEVPNNIIKMSDLSDYDFNDFDYIIYGPLFNNNISKDVFEGLNDFKSKKVLAAQGMIRYLDGDSIIWSNPDKALEVLRYTDYVFLDENELEFISSGRGVHLLKNRGADNVIVTNGCNGSRLFLDKEYYIKAFKPINGLDNDWTGAGDSYMAGLLIAFELLNDPIQQGLFAAMTATINSECDKGFDKDKNYVLKRFLKNKI